MIMKFNVDFTLFLFEYREKRAVKKMNIFICLKLRSKNFLSKMSLKN